MARPRRRSGRLNPGVGTPEPTDEAPVGSQQTEDDGPPKQTNGKQEDDKCPACSPDNPPIDTESWVRCDACKRWFHWRCAGKGELEAIDKWFCRPCLDEDTKRVITMKPPARKSSRKRTLRDYAGLHNTGQEQESDPHKWMRMLEGKDIKPNPFRRMEGSELTMDWVEHDDEAFREPVLIEKPEGLGMKMPDSSFTVENVAEIVGADTPVEVIDVASQSNSPGWNLRKWADYYALEPDARDRVRNVISLEITGTDMADMILPPRLVREMDWVEKFWPSTKKGRGHTYPKVQLYCLMGVANAWTDWHIDFAGSSVYYHILHGAKVFYFIRPTPANLAAYERWSGTEMQSHSWLGDMCDDVYKVELAEGNTMIIPTGWIHAVYTPVDTLVFGGNFLHSYNMATQLRVREIEIATHVPKKFRFPFFVKLCWYTAEKYLRDLKAKEEFHPRVLESIEALADFLVSEARTMEKGTEQAKKSAKDQVPGDRIKDAPAIARELRWRVRLAGGYSSDDDAVSRKRRKPATSHSEATSVTSSGTKRKRLSEDHEEVLTPPFRNFRPKSWDKIVERPLENDERTVKMKRIDEKGEGWKDIWTEQVDADEDGEEVTVKSSKNVLVKVRRTVTGLERHRVERVVEEWEWLGEGGLGADKPKAEGSSPVAGGSSEVVYPKDQPNGKVDPSAMAVDANGEDP